MRRDITQNVEIKEPPIEELTRKYSAFSTIKRSCIGGCGCLVFLIIALIILVKLFLGVGPQTISSVPQNFPANIPIYDENNIDKIIYVSGTYKNRAMEVAALFPKLILSPLISALDQQDLTDTNKQVDINNLWKIMNSRVGDKRNVIKISWKELTADPAFVYNYYQNELTKAEYEITSYSNSKTDKQFSFGKGNISGTFYIKNGDTNDGTDFASLIVNYYPVE